MFVSINAINVAVGGNSSVITIGGGTGVGYTVGSSDTSVATVTTSPDGSAFIVNGAANGPATITVTDSLGTAVSVRVVVGTGVKSSSITSGNVIASSVATKMSLTPATVTVADDNGSTHSLNLSGMTAPFRVYNSNPSLATLTIVGDNSNSASTSNTINVAPGPITATNKSGRCVSQDTAVIFTVIDSLNAVATSTMTIKAGGVGC
ncbi:hypothetical protein ACO0KY_01725 [Undibacterium sp. Dicai25W]